MYLRVREIAKPYEPCHTKTEVSYNGAMSNLLYIAQTLKRKSGVNFTPRVSCAVFPKLVVFNMRTAINVRTPNFCKKSLFGVQKTPK